MGKLILIGAGGFLGAVLRFLVSAGLQSWSKQDTFPYGTLAVNLIGCLVIGLLSQLVEAHDVLNPEARAFVFVGTLGAFTTFSTFGNDSVNLLRAGESFLAALNVGAQLFLGLSAVWLGRFCAQLLWP